MSKSRSAFTIVDWSGLTLLWLFTITVLAGFGTFGLNPSLLTMYPDAAGFYGYAFIIFSRGHVILALIVLGLLLTPRIKLRWLSPLIIASIISLGMELLGTKTGFPFSGYEYTSLMGYKITNLVPALIPISWFLMAFPSYVLARKISTNTYLQWVIGAFLLTVWDLTLDPAMSDLTNYWVWDNHGPYYGMPLVNLLGWFGTGLLIMAGFHYSGSGKMADQIHPPIMEFYYFTVILLSLGMTLLAGYWLAVILTFVVIVGLRVVLSQKSKIVTTQ